MRIWASVVMVFFFLNAAAQAAAPGDSAGIALESTRVIYPGKAKRGTTFTLTNRTEQTYLLQSRVTPWGAVARAPSSATVAPFIVVPPLVRFAADDELTLRIQLTKNDLPTDRESVFVLSLKAIPSQSTPGSESEEGAKMMLALQNNLKLFYRPTELVDMTGEERAGALQFTLHGTELKVHNPTPYYVTLGEVKADSQTVVLHDQRMLAPFSTVEVNLPVTRPASVSWQIIDDDGLPTPRQSQSLH